MARYIELDAVLAEIERRKEKCELFYNIALSNNAEFANLAIEEQKKQYDSFKGFINTLEVKEVDLENIAAVEWDDYIRKIDGEPDTAFMLIKRNEYIELAKHFFSLGLKAQKGELV